MQKALRILVWFFLAYAIAAPLLNLLTLSFRDHASALVMLTSWIALKLDLPLFHHEQFFSVYNLMYGPLLYVSHWPAFLLFGGSFFAGKLVGTLAFFSGLWFLYQIAKKFSSSIHGLLVLVYFIPFMLAVEDFSYGNRADSLLLFLSLAGAFIFWSAKLSDQAKLFLLSILMGLSFNLKIHSVMYLAPFVGALAFRSIKNFFQASAVFLVTCAFPWLFFPDQFAVYARVLTSISRQMSLVHEGKQVIILNLWTLVFFLCFWRMKFDRGPLHGPLLRYLAVVSICVATFLASRRGSGTNQIIPLISCYLIFLKSAEPRVILAKYKWAISLALIYLFASFVNSQQEMFRYFSRGTEFQVKSKDLKALVAELPEKSVLFGYSATNYMDTYLRPEIYFMQKGSAFIVDAVTLMEYVHSKIPFPEAAYQKLENCIAAYAITPKQGEPFGLNSYYEPGPVIFDQRWRELFQKKYHKISDGEYFTLWQCAGPT